MLLLHVYKPAKQVYTSSVLLLFAVLHKHSDFNGLGEELSLFRHENNLCTEVVLVPFVLLCLCCILVQSSSKVVPTNGIVQIM